MKLRSGLISLAIGMCVAAGMVAFPGAALAQGLPAAQDTQAERQAVQPGNNAPVWREVQAGEANYTSIKGPETGVLIQPQAKFFGQDSMTTAGEAWRKYRNGPITFFGGWLIVLIAAALGVFYLWKGPIKLHQPPSGRMVLRFSAIERWAHWSMAISFCVLGVSGLVLFFGKHIILPVIGYTLFSWLSVLMKNLHNFVGPLFMLSILLFFVIYVRHNLPAKGDVQWLTRLGGMLSGKEVPSGRFNAGEKGWFWIGVVVLGIVMSVTGVILLFPNFEQVRTTMQQASIVHAAGGALFIAMSLAHIYLGTIGMQGAYEGMRTGYVDETWAKEHHELWHDEIKSGKSGGDVTAPGAQVQH